ncbi:AglZ/HisF2 family acetamidino modification protein [Prochlorococcus marinus]|uniref:AglZ/HisF2 family acetamidino modification protein n=1 Tax=Prochlorococcus marinus TaxID=1219 RepID=UPI0022B322A7|nr:AglZ/HisF2 family acetamidino modification protein [Prochlorococcus marinus]
MLRTRIIPVLLLKGESLVKTIKFKNFTYVGDPCNSLRIFNELEVDELMVLDISASKEKKSPNFSLIKDMCSECFMPLSYGGGIRTIEHAKKLFDLGIEKIVLNTYAIENHLFISQLSSYFGSQAIIVSIDIRKRRFAKKDVFSNTFKSYLNLDPIDWAKQAEELGAGELLLTSVDNEGTWQGMDFDLIKNISQNISIPLIAHGGAGNLDHIKKAIHEGGASAVGLGSMVTFQKKGMGVLIHMPKLENFN